MKTFRRIFSTILAIAMCLSVNMYAYAAENSCDTDNIPTISEQSNNTVPSNLIGEATYLVSDSGIMPLSSVSGFNQKTITSTSDSLIINCSGSGTGGMGITIQATSSYGDYVVKFSGKATGGSASSLSGNLCTNNPLEYHNLWQSNLTQYKFTFTTSSKIPAYLVKVWIYG